MGSKKSNCNNALIVLEGLPCSGKTTVAMRLAKDLSAVLISESSPSTQVKNLERINFYLDDLRKSQNSHNGNVFIVDRYFLSTIAFEETLKSLTKRKLLNRQLLTLYDFKHCCGKKFYSLLLKYGVLRRPNMVVYLKIPISVSIKRQERIKRNFSEHNIWRNKRFLLGFQKFCLENAKKYYSVKSIIIDANRPLGKIYLIIKRRLEKIYEI